MRALLAALFVLAAPTAALAQVPPDLARDAHEYERAQIEGDGAALERLIADDYVLVGGDGSRTDKAAHIAEFTAPEMDLQPVTVREAVEHVWPNGAALGGTVDIVGAYAGAPFRQTLRYIDVWALRDGRWQVVYGQATRVPAAD
ncbi:MAG: nuclear transport factor 2 family protein [Brevundimonas sp.]|nr:MAG: nuclear transport factor 2 family protein [Brevundimonas sp.]